MIYYLVLHYVLKCISYSELMMYAYRIKFSINNIGIHASYIYKHILKGEEQTISKSIFEVPIV